MADTTLSEYQAKLRQLQAAVEHARLSQHLILGSIAVAIALALALWFLGSARRVIPAWCALMPVPILFGAGRRFAKNRSAWRRLLRLQASYEGGLARLEDRWAGTGKTGEEFLPPDHACGPGLNVVGAGSLFELLCTARTGIGQRRLAEYLLDQPEDPQQHERQQAVRELTTDKTLREDIAVLGRFDFRESTWETFSEWLGVPDAPASRLVRLIALVSSTVTASLILALLVTSIPPMQILRWLPGPLLLNAVIAFEFRRRTRALNHAARRIGLEIGVLREGIELIGRRKFAAAKLVAIQNGLGGGRAADALRKLERLTNALGDCDRELFILPARLVIARTQLCLAIEDWKRRHGPHLENWIAHWAEFEALAAISGYAYEHPEDVFPEFSDGGALFDASAMGHPLLPAGACVRNDVRLGPDRRFCIVSGSNMAGKSTLLRAIGLNAVLAYAGAPVRAASLRLSSLTVCASLSIVDSLSDGKSKFLAEVERLRRTLELARLPRPVLFLIDEILSGTNSRDRRIVSESVVRALGEWGAIGVLTTHDLALTEIAGLDGTSGVNVHMGSRSRENAMDFDYLVKPGIAGAGNALAIARMVGIPV